MELTPKQSNELKCEYCNKTFKRASAFEVHVCIKKQRALQRNEKRARYGLMAYNIFNNFNSPSKKHVSYDEFCDSQYYNAFVNFGSYLSNVRPLYPEKYIEYVIKRKLKIKDWSSDSVYEEYVLSVIKRESADTAIKRTIETMMEWATVNNSQWNHYFKYVSPERAVWDIRDGKISPWVILHSANGKQLLNALEDAQLEQIFAAIEPTHWTSQFKRNPIDVQTVKLLVEEYKL